MSTKSQTPAALLSRLIDASIPDGLAALKERDEPGSALVSAADEAERLVMADLNKGLELTQKLVRLADALGDPLARARTRRGWAQALAYANRFDDALVALGDGHRLAMSCGAVVEAARSQMTTLHALARNGKLEDAVLAGQRARAAFVSAGEPGLAARADLNLGVVERMRDNPRAAIEHFDRAAPSLADQPMILAQLQSNRAEALLDINRFEDAEAAFGAALAEFQRLGVARAAGIVEGNLADLTGRQGRLDLALRHFERARRQLGEQEAPGDIARLKAEQAETMAALGLHAEASDTFREAIPVLAERQMAWELARAQAGLGRSLIRLGRLDEAATALEQAAAGFEKLNNTTGSARVKLALAEIAERRGEPEGAEALLESALKLLPDRPAESTLAELRLAALSLRRGRHQEAADRAGAALLHARELDLAPVMADVLQVRARALRSLGRLGEALVDLRDAMGQVERVRGSLQAERFRAAFLGNRIEIYEDAIGCALDAGLTDEAFAITERSRGRWLLEMVSGAGRAGASLGDDRETVLLAELERSRSHLNALYAKLDDPSARGRTPTDMAAWREDVRAHELRIRTAEDRLAATQRYAGVFGRTAELAQVRDLLEPGTTLIEFVREGGKLSAIVSSATSTGVCRGLAGPDEVADAVESLSFQIGRAIMRGLPTGPGGERLLKDADRDLRLLYDMLLRPMESAIAGSKRLVIVPQGSLHAVPFHALSDQGTALVERMETMVAPSASVLRRLREDGVPRGAGALVVGLSDPTIPLAETEAAQIAESLPGSRLLSGAEATIANFREAASGAGLIHLATHARFIASNPMASGVKLADGWLTAHDVYALSLRRPIITLSACESGRGSISAGEEILGLAHAFLGAGARALVLSLWPVHDRLTADFMVSACGALYNPGLAVGNDPVSAVRAAQLLLRGRHPHPAAWAPFTLVGAA